METSPGVGHDWGLLGFTSGSDLPIYQCLRCEGVVTMDRGKVPSSDQPVPILFMGDPARFFTCGEYMAWNIHKE
jgi:hypothetical protein